VPEAAAGAAGAVVGAPAGPPVGFEAAAGALVGFAAGALVGIGVLADVQPASSRHPHIALTRRRRDMLFILPGALE
jgi:zinc transporter ZupT